MKISLMKINRGYNKKHENNLNMFCYANHSLIMVFEVKL